MERRRYPYHCRQGTLLCGCPESSQNRLGAGKGSVLGDRKIITLTKQPKVILVNEVYPTDCLIFKALVSANQPRYRVPGHEDALIPQQSPTPAVSSETSLQLKPEKGDPLPGQQTPSRTEGSEQVSLSRATEDATHAFPQDDLDKAIEVAQATKNLVRISKLVFADYALTVL